MKFFFMLLSLLWIPVGIMAQNSENKDVQVFHIGLSSANFENINLNDAIAAMKAWTETVFRERQLKESAEVKFFSSFEELSQAYKNNWADAISMTTEDSIRLGLIPEFVYLTSRDNGFHVSYSILVHRNSAIKNTDELAEKKLVIYEGHQMILARLWLKSILAEHAAKAGNGPFKNLISVDNPSKVILQIFFRQADAAVITTDAFDLACELNPQLRKDILVLSTSPPFVTSFFFFRPSWYGVSREKLESAILELHTTPGGRQVLNVFQSTRIEKKPGTILESTHQFLIKNQQFLQNGPFKQTQP